MSELLPFDVRNLRNEFASGVQNRVRGFRTNGGTGIESGNQIGVVNFDYSELRLNLRYIDTIKNWKHPGQTTCDTSAPLSLYQRNAESLGISRQCGISGSTNFWIWTALGIILTL